MPLSRNFCPSSLKSSVGNGPLPTLVQYALNIPKTSPIRRGAIPKPVHAPAHTVFEDVTNGYDPKSISSNDHCAPSAKTEPPSLR